MWLLSEFQREVPIRSLLYKPTVCNVYMLTPDQVTERFCVNNGYTKKRLEKKTLCFCVALPFTTSIVSMQVG